ncbi:hypothetical protein B0H34DRAFT_674240 [Crassisporium funariophilum]|nr:hypothetical protein B0H34DRAFT_674240 [Crassisporium funariophilum]
MPPKDPACIQQPEADPFEFLDPDGTSKSLPIFFNPATMKETVEWHLACHQAAAVCNQKSKSNARWQIQNAEREKLKVAVGILNERGPSFWPQRHGGLAPVFCWGWVWVMQIAVTFIIIGNYSNYKLKYPGLNAPQEEKKQQEQIDLLSYVFNFVRPSLFGTMQDNWSIKNGSLLLCLNGIIAAASVGQLKIQPASQGVGLVSLDPQYQQNPPSSESVGAEVLSVLGTGFIGFFPSRVQRATEFAGARRAHLAHIMVPLGPVGVTPPVYRSTIASLGRVQRATEFAGARRAHSAHIMVPLGPVGVTPPVYRSTIASLGVS